MKNWSLQLKIIAVISIFVVSNLLVLGVGLSKLDAADKTNENMVGVLAARVELVNKLKYLQTLIAVHSRDGVLESTAADTNAQLKKMTAERGEQEQQMDAFEKIASPEGKALLAAYRKQFSDWFMASTQALELNAEGKHAEAVVQIKTKAAPLCQVMAETLEKNIQLNLERMETAAKAANAEFDRAVVMLCMMCFVALFAGSCLATFILRRVNRSINNVVQTLQANADQVAAASQQIASSSEELSQAATEQASSLEETASSLEEISAMIGKASEAAGTTAAKSSESQSKAEEGRNAVEQMLSSMSEISQSNEAIMAQINVSNQQMGEIVRVIKEIGDKTKVINEIVFQTKLLSFNASVEAARAGDHGKGFAVVAEEVGNLAQMSGNAAMEISEMLSGSIGTVERIVNDTKSKVQDLTERGKRKVESGVEVARQCSVILQEIVNNVTRVSGLAQEISEGSAEQSQGVGEINKAMAQLDAVTQQNASTSEEAASAAEELSAQAEGLKDSVVELVRVIHGGDAAAAPSTRTTTLPRYSPKRELKPTAKVVRLKPPVARAERMSSVKMAAGDAMVPSRDDEGFKDV